MVAIEEVVSAKEATKSNASSSNDKIEQHDALVSKMEATRQKWTQEKDSDDDSDSDDDQLLQQAIDMAIQHGKGWSPGEKEEYMAKILDDYIPPMFCSTAEELQRTGLADAFSALQYDDDPAITMYEHKQKGTDAFVNGKRNQVNNIQYYRTAVNHYYEAIAWVKKIEPSTTANDTINDNDKKENTKHSNNDNASESEPKPIDPSAPPSTSSESKVIFQQFTETELDDIKSTLYSNAALCHLQLKNWGHVRDDSIKAVSCNKQNVKAWYRLAKAYQMLQDWELAGNAIDSGLSCNGEYQNKDLIKLQSLLQDKIRKARIARQKRERIRAERMVQIKQVWKHCNNNEKGQKIKLGRVALVASVSENDNDDVDDADFTESKWHHHFPHTGLLPQPTSSSSSSSSTSTSSSWTWPCLFIYPSHSQSDFVKHFNEDEMLAIRMAEMFPEVDDVDQQKSTTIPWDYNNDFQCSKLAVYFEVHCPDDNDDDEDDVKTNKKMLKQLVHPDSIERLLDQATTMRFYESSRALKGDEGPEMANLAKVVEQKRLLKQRKAWKKKHGSLWSKPDPCPVVRVHPAMTLKDILTDPRMVAVNFVVTLIMIPEDHPAHEAYLKEHKCIGILQPKDIETSK